MVVGARGEERPGSGLGDATTVATEASLLPPPRPAAPRDVSAGEVVREVTPAPARLQDGSRGTAYRSIQQCPGGWAQGGTQATGRSARLTAATATVAMAATTSNSRAGRKLKLDVTPEKKSATASRMVLMM